MNYIQTTIQFIQNKFATNDFIPLHAPVFNGNERKYVMDTIDSTFVSSVGAYVDKAEQMMAKISQTKKAVAVVNGTSGLQIALQLTGVQAGEEVLTQALTFVATANAIHYTGAEPVFLDVDYDTMGLSAKAVSEFLEKFGEKRENGTFNKKTGKRISACVPMHTFGFPVHLDALMDVCNEWNIPVVEDAAESLGSYYKGKHTGSFGKFGVFSFNGNKIITTSGGGMLVSDDEEKIKKVRFWSTQSRDAARHYQHSELGFNYRMSNVVAGIGRGQLKVLDQRVAKKKYIFEFYKRELGQLEGVEFMPINDWNEPNYWLSVMTLKSTVRPLDVMEALEKENIESRPVWKPMHMQPFFAEYDYVGGDVSEKLFENGVCLPSDTKMTDEDLERISGIIKSLWK